MIPEFLMHNGQRKRVVYWHADWSLNLRAVPHTLWIVWEGAGKKAERFTSDASGEFAELGECDA